MFKSCTQFDIGNFYEHPLTVSITQKKTEKEFIKIEITKKNKID